MAAPAISPANSQKNDDSAMAYCNGAKKATSKDEINAIMRAAASEGPLKGVLGYNDLPLVSIDFNHTNEASIFDSTLTKVMDGNMVKVSAWYDNEWGFSVQMLNTAKAMMEA